MEPTSSSPRSVLSRVYALSGGSGDCARCEELRVPPLSALDRVPTARVFGASVSRVESALPELPHKPRRPPPATAAAAASSTARASRNHQDSDAFVVLHPSLDLADDDGELSKLLLDQWSVDAGEARFSSLAVFCEMKLSEAQRMTSWVETPNRFFTTAALQLLDKFVRRLETTGDGSAAFLRKVHDAMVAAIFLPAATGPGTAFELRVPYSLEYKKLRRQAQFLMAAVENDARHAALKERLPRRLDAWLTTQQRVAERRRFGQLFRAWRDLARHAAVERRLKYQAFRASRQLNVGALFRAWRIEALRRAYQRESVEYQTMLSITAASLSRKDVLLAESEGRVASMAKIIDSLTESNAQLLFRVEQLEAIAAGKGGAAALALGPGGSAGGLLSFHRGGRGEPVPGGGDAGAGGSTLDALLGQDDEKSDRSNRMLLETMFGMARMVESCAIQMAKDVMDSLELQLDGSLLVQLAEMIHADNVAKAKAEESRQSVGTPPATRKSSRYSAAAGGAGGAAAVGGVVAVKDLTQMPVDTVLLNWFRMHLQQSAVADRSSDRVVKNFTTDLVDGRRLALLLHRLFPTWFDANMVHEIDVDERLKHLAGFHARVQPELPQVLTVDSIHAGSAPENVAFVAMLFGTSVQSLRRLNLERQRGQFLNVITSWKRVRSLMLEVKRMNDNYDALMVAHLLKEMRTCETLFKQLNSDLCAIAVAANESAATHCHLAYQILQLTWRCLRARETHSLAALALVDERLQDRMRDFARVDVATVRQLLVADAQRGVGGPRRSLVAAPTPVIPEKDVVVRTDAVRGVLSVYCKDLHDIFKHYSASSGAGSIASMSMSEFLKFIKDIAVCDKQLPPAAVELLFKTALFYSPLLPRDVAAAAVAAVHAASAPPDAPAESGGLLQPPESVLALIDLGDREMSALEFVDALVRLAAVKMPPPAPLEERFRELMEQFVLPNALRSQAEIFRAEVASPKVRAVFQKHKATLQRIFRYYSSMHALREQQSTIDLKEFTVLAKDCKLIGSFVTEHTLKQVLGNVQRDDVDGGDRPQQQQQQQQRADALRVDFADFQEALAALTEYVICNPYVPLYKRVEQFINELLIPRARQKKKAAGE
ncbi:hypothetical protein ATCC90586_003833 [Pythium insidiosum]|nr:hypothetical protein ATCC90586_003833 [Pythium insidiosum]